MPIGEHPDAATRYWLVSVGTDARAVPGMGMGIGAIGTSAEHPAFLPVRQGRPGNFSASLRAHIRGEVAKAIAVGSAPSRQATQSSEQGVALNQWLLGVTRSGGDSGQWAETARTIGSKYLPNDVADLFSRQMALESGGFDPDVINGRRVSSAGAEGIAQLMPSSYPNVNRRDPVASLNAAASTMQGNLQRYGGDVRKALAAYNAGAGTVDRLVAQYGAGWEQGLPAETRTYLSELVGGRA